VSWSRKGHLSNRENHTYYWNRLKITLLDRLLLLVTGFLAAWQVAVGISNLGPLPIIAYTIGFGILLIAALLFLILGYDVLDSPIVAIMSTIIPLSLSLGLVSEYLSAWQTPTLVFVVLGFLAIIITRSFPLKNLLPVIVLSIVHGIAGIIILLLPFFLVFNGSVTPWFSLVGMGGALIGLEGMLLYFQKAGKPILPAQLSYKILPGLLLLSTAAFVFGFSAA
jgi:uncharacterized membrane protein YjjP (DUF1212 family)